MLDPILFLFKLPNSLLNLYNKLFCISANCKCLFATIVESKRRFPENKKQKFKKQCTDKVNIIFVTNSFGGITDWFKGMVSLFDFCEINKYNFKIYAKDKFDFNRFFVTNSYNWTMSDWEYSEVNNSTGVLHLCLSKSKKGGGDTWLEQQYTLKKICDNKKVSNVFVHSVAPYGLPTFAKRFKELFAMSPYLCSVVEPMRNRISPYMAIALRFVNLLGDSDESVFGIDSINNKEQELLLQSCVSELKKLIEENNNLNVLVTTDSYRFLSYIDEDPTLREKVNHLVGDKVHHHIGFSNEVTDLGITKSYAEFMLISMAEKVYQIQIGSMYESKFPKWAASINNKKYQLINK